MAPLDLLPKKLNNIEVKTPEAARAACDEAIARGEFDNTAWGETLFDSCVGLMEDRKGERLVESSLGNVLAVFEDDPEANKAYAELISKLSEIREEAHRLTRKAILECMLKFANTIQLSGHTDRIQTMMNAMNVEA